jgi:type I restriction enzyme R subunit
MESLSPEQKEALIDSDLYEHQEYIESMLTKIFRRQSVMEKFAVRNGMPTMSAILTTSSIAQAKRIYHKLKQMQRYGTLLNGEFLDERLTLQDPDFPRVAITYSERDEQGEIREEQAELEAIIADYNATFSDMATAETYRPKVNARLARKQAQYQKDGQWLDLVIVVDQLLTGFDAPNMQTLFIDRDLRYQKLLQAFSRTNRLCPGKKAGMVVSFRKPNTMRQNIEDAIRLFSDEDQDWADLVPREYSEVKEAFNAARDELNRAKSELELDPQNLSKKVEQVRAFQQLEKHYGALKSYDQFQEEASEFADFEEIMRTERGFCENLKGEIKAEITDGAGPASLLQGIEFTSGNRATITEQIDSYYIARLFGQYQAAFEEETQDQAVKDRQEELRNQILAVIEDKPETVKRIYLQILNDMSKPSVEEGSVSKPRPDADLDWKDYFRRAITMTLEGVAKRLQVPVSSLQTSLNEYRGPSEPVPYFNQILSLAELAKNKEAFENEFHEMFRRSTKVIEQYWRGVLENELLPLKGEL